jgi:ABC-type dipeptide/oligopeptide/nickel transport system permease component
VSTLCFLVVRSLPGDIAFRIAAGRYGYDQVNAASADVVRAELGLDRPAWQQLFAWVADLAWFDLGTSLVTGGRVVDELSYHLGASLQLAAVALALSSSWSSRCSSGSVARDTVAEIRQSDHVRFAETKGLSTRLVLARHVARNSGVTLVAYLGVQALILIEGVVVVESLFAWPSVCSSSS